MSFSSFLPQVPRQRVYTNFYVLYYRLLRILLLRPLNVVDFVREEAKFMLAAGFEDRGAMSKLTGTARGIMDLVVGEAVVSANLASTLSLEIIC